MQESYKDTYFELMQQFWRWSDEQKRQWQVPLRTALRENNTTKLPKALRRLSIDKKDILKKDYISKLQNPATQDRTLSDLANSYSGVIPPLLTAFKSRIQLLKFLFWGYSA